jgi:AAA+ ATPase superfamily predicted ATPase
MLPPHFLHRTRELASLDRLTRRAESSLVLIFGRRRVGKSTLARHWAGKTRWPVFYWESPRSTAENVRASLLRELYLWKGERVVEDRPRAADWLEVFRIMRRLIGQQPAVAILDEFPWAVEADPGLPSFLKNAWDNVFADTQLKMLIVGSHISAMEKLLESDAPLFGRMAGKVLVRPFSFVEITPYVRHYELEKRLAVYAIVGGIPDYLRRWDDRANLMSNIREIFISDDSPFRNEHMVLISDVLRRESPDYEAVLEAVGRGRHDLDAIAIDSVLASGRAAGILTQLTEVRLVERRIRATVPMSHHAQARHAHYHLADPFLRFYHRFVAPNRSRIAQDLGAALEQQFTAQTRAFVGAEFEELCRTWTLVQARHGRLLFLPDFVGSDWGPQHQADVVAVNWRQHQVLIGEAKWEDDDFDHGQWRQFLDRAEHVVARLRTADPARKPKREPPAWERHLALFTRRSATAAVRSAAKAAGAQVFTFAELVRDLERLPEHPDA